MRKSKASSGEREMIVESHPPGCHILTFYKQKKVIFCGFNGEHLQLQVTEKCKAMMVKLLFLNSPDSPFFKLFWPTFVLRSQKNTTMWGGVQRVTWILWHKINICSVETENTQGWTIRNWLTCKTRAQLLQESDWQLGFGLWRIKRIVSTLLNYFGII